MLLETLQELSISDIRKTIRAYRKMFETAPMLKYHQLSMKLVHASLDLPKNAFWGLIPKEYEEHAKDYLRQIRFSTQGEGKNSAAMMRHCTGDSGPFVFLANKTWCDIVESEGMKIQKFRSLVLWRLMLVIFWFSALRFVVRVTIETLMATDKRTPETSYAVFSDMRRDHLPPNEASIEQSDDLLSWWKRSVLYRDDLESLWFSGSYIDPATVDIDKVKIVCDPLPTLASVGAYTRFMLTALPVLAVSLGRTLLGHWWAPMILRQALMLNYARQLPDDGFADEYYYNCTNMFTRPLWTHYAENYGARFTVIQYSQSFRYCYLSGRSDLTLYSRDYSLCTWSRYAVMDHDHAQELDRAIQEYRKNRPLSVEYVEVGPIGWRDNGMPIQEFDGPAIAILDSPPHRSIHMAAAGMTPRYHSDPKIFLSFLEHAFKAARDIGFIPVYKSKVAIDGDQHPNSRYPLPHKIAALIKKYDCKLIDCDISIMRVIQYCDAVIATPFTSAGVNACLLEKPVAFYDPIDRLRGFERHTHGGMLLHNERDLRSWLCKISKSRNN